MGLPFRVKSTVSVWASRTVRQAHGDPPSRAERGRRGGLPARERPELLEGDRGPEEGGEADGVVVAAGSRCRTSETAIWTSGKAARERISPRPSRVTVSRQPIEGLAGRSRKPGRGETRRKPSEGSSGLSRADATRFERGGPEVQQEGQRELRGSQVRADDHEVLWNQFPHGLQLDDEL